MNAHSASGAEKECLIPFYTLDRKKQSLIAFKTGVAMRWYAFLPLLLVFLLVTATSSPDQAGDLGQVTLTVNAVCTATVSSIDPGNFSIQDSVTVNMTETITYRVVRLWGGGQGGIADLEVISHANSLSASGGGIFNVPNYPPASRKWSYTIQGQVESPLVGLHLDYGDGHLVVSPVNFASAGHLKSTGDPDHPGAAGGVADTGVGDAVSQLSVPTAKQDFAQQCKKTFKPWPKDLYVSGSASHHFSLDSEDGHTKQSADLTMTYTVSNNPSPEGEAEIIPPSEYTHWMPKAGDDEEKPGNTIKVEARIYKKGDPTKPSSKKARFKFELVDVSKEKGVCLNWPEIAKDDFDLKIEPKTNSSLKVDGDGQSARSAAGLSESTVTITSHDWGAYGKLRVIAIFDDGSEVNAHVKGDQSKYSLTIPKDDNVNHIADIWEKLFPIGSYDAKADDDLYPIGDNSLGDGLSLYEEYRGFWIQGRHEYTSPIQKDLFVFDRDELGTGDFALSGLTIQLIKVKEAGWESTEPNPFVINHNRGLLTRGPQHILRIINAEAEGYLGLTYGFGTPKDIRIIKIDVAKCDKQSPDWRLRTIAHELAHGCHVDHHGNSNYKASELEVLDPLSGSWLKSDEKGPFSVAAQGQQESGVEKCIMRYCGEILYENPKGEWRWKKPPTGEWQRGEFYGEGEDTGHIFCDDPKGTGVNAPQGYQGVSKAGNATKGNCKGQFCVNDNKH
jgi:hypothetical protein